MSTIQKPDPFLPAYIVEKQMHPDTRIVLRAYQKKMVDRIDAIVELAHGQRELVTSEHDWKIVEELMKFFAAEWPHEWSEFKTSIPDIRSSRNDKGYSESKEIMYVGAIPPRLMKMIKAIFPMQQWDKKFTSKFVKRFKLFKVGGA